MPPGSWQGCSRNSPPCSSARARARCCARASRS
jgi:hypothetical protein